MPKCDKAELTLDELDRVAATGELTDAELESITGGKDGPGPRPGPTRIRPVYTAPRRPWSWFDRIGP